MDQSIFIIENDTQKDIENYNARHIKDLERNYFVEESDIGNDDITCINKTVEKGRKASSIRKYFNSLNVDEMIKMVNMHTTEKEYKRKLLAYELQYYREKPCNLTMKQFIIKATTILSRYQSKAGGSMIEDLDWTMLVAENNTDEYSVSKNEIMFENSICRCDKDDSETNQFITLIVEQLNSVATNASVHVTFDDDDNNGLVWINVWCCFE
jgi:hypothetical protein